MNSVDSMARAQLNINININTKNTKNILVRQEWLNTAIWAIGRFFVINMKGELIFCVKSPTYLRLYDH